MEKPFGEMTDSEVSTALQEAAAGGYSKERAERFYDRVRGSIQKYLDKKGRAVEKSAEFLLLVPDVFMLLWRLARDSRVSGKNKVLLATGVAYYILPFDLIPEAIVGPIGYLDDLVFGVYILNKVLKDTDVSVVREHWSGSDDVLESIQRVLLAAESLISTQVVARIKRIVK